MRRKVCRQLEELEHLRARFASVRSTTVTHSAHIVIVCDQLKTSAGQTRERASLLVPRRLQPVADRSCSTVLAYSESFNFLWKRCRTVLRYSLPSRGHRHAQTWWRTPLCPFQCRARATTLESAHADASSEHQLSVAPSKRGPSDSGGLKLKWRVNG